MKKIIILILMGLLLIPSAFAGGKDVTISFPEFDITLNGTKVNNASERYPFILYKGITYIPMTWDLSNALGLKSKWHAETGLEISKNVDMIVYQQKEVVLNDTRGLYNAEIVSFPVTVNGKVIDNTKEEYPLLTFRNVTYFPMTYHYMVREFGSGYEWDNDKGLSVAADKKLSVHIPKATTFTMDSSITELAEKGGLVEAMMTLEPYTPKSSNDAGTMAFEILSNYSPLYENYLITTEMMQYDLDGNLMHSDAMSKPTQYVVNKGSVYPFWISSYGTLANFDHFVLTATLTPPSIARAIL
jgi:hypothetical protein